jgi:hypothetical protein
MTPRRSIVLQWYERLNTCDLNESLKKDLHLLLFKKYSLVKLSDSEITRLGKAHERLGRVNSGETLEQIKQYAFILLQISNSLPISFFRKFQGLLSVSFPSLRLENHKTRS